MWRSMAAARCLQPWQDPGAAQGAARTMGWWLSWRGAPVAGSGAGRAVWLREAGVAPGGCGRAGPATAGSLDGPPTQAASQCQRLQQAACGGVRWCGVGVLQGFQRDHARIQRAVVVALGAVVAVAAAGMAGHQRTGCHALLAPASQLGHPARPVVGRLGRGCRWRVPVCGAQQAALHISLPMQQQAQPKQAQQGAERRGAQRRQMEGRHQMRSVQAMPAVRTASHGGCAAGGAAAQRLDSPGCRPFHPQRPIRRPIPHPVLCPLSPARRRLVPCAWPSSAAARPA